MIDLSPMLPLINIVGFLILGSAMIFTQWRLGGNQVSGAVIQAYKEQTVLQDKKLNELSHELGVLTGKLLEKDKQITILQAAIAGRDPDSLALGQAALAFIKRSDDREERIEKLLKRLAK